MSKEVINAVKFRDPIQPEIGPDRHLFVLRCDDDSVYEFQKLEDDPYWSMRTRGNLNDRVSSWNSRRSPLPKDVKDTLNEEAGKKNWRK